MDALGLYILTLKIFWQDVDFLTQCGVRSNIIMFAPSFEEIAPKGF